MKHWTLLLLAAAGCTHPDTPDGKKGPDWQVLFDGKSLAGWKATEFGGEGKIEIKDGQVILNEGAALTGITWAGPDLPTIDYEVELEAMKVDGTDIMCGICFPVNQFHCSFVAGGWGGEVVGLSSIDGMTADGNDTTKIMTFKKGQWYAIRLKVTKAKIEAWIDGKPMIDLDLKDRQISLHPAMEMSKPFGLTTYGTTSAMRKIRLRKIP